MSKGISRYPLSAIRHPLSAVLGVALILVACAPKGEALYSRANEAMAKGDTRAAVIDLKNLVKDEPRNAKARALLGQALVDAGDVSGAGIELQKAKELGATPGQLFVPDCLLLSARGEADKVLAQCSPDKVEDSAKVQLQVAQGRALMQLDRAADASVQFRAALVARPESLNALVGLAGAMYRTDGLAAAKTVLDQASDSIKKDPAYWMTMGGVSAEGGDYTAAEKAYQSAVESARGRRNGNDHLIALGALAEVQMRQGKVKEASATAKQLELAAPNNPLVKMLRGQIAAAGGDYDQARTLLEEAVAAMPENYQARLLLGMVNMQQGNLGQAEMQFENVVANQPTNVQALRLLTELRARTQSPEETLEEMKPALAQASADPSLLAMASRLSLASGDREQALSYLAQAAARPAAEQSAETTLEVASGFVMAGEFDRAVELLESMPQTGATGYQREYLLMAALLRKGDKERALAEANALVERSGDDPKARNLIAAVFSATGQPDAGRQQLEEALKLKPDDQQTLINLGRLDLVQGMTADAERRFRKVLEADPTNIVATMGVAVSLGTQGNAKEAETWLKKAAAAHPDSVQVQLALAQFYLGRIDYGKAKAVIDEAMSKAPDNAALANARGLALLGLKDVPGSIASFQKATQDAPKAYGYALNLARAYLVDRNLKGALDVLNGVLKSEPKFLPALALAGAASLQEGDLEKATGYIERLRQAAPDSTATLALEGDLSMAQKRYRDALGFYRKARAKGLTREILYAEYRASQLAGEPKPEALLEQWVVEHPEDTAVVAGLAEVKHQAGDQAGAIALYEKALERAPNNPEILNNLAVLYQEQKNPKALPAAERAYNLSPKVPAIQDTYGWLLLENGKTDKAVEILGQASKGMADNSEVQYHYAASLAKAGRPAEALPLLKKAVAGKLPARAREDAEALLKQLSN